MDAPWAPTNQAIEGNLRATHPINRSYQIQHLGGDIFQASNDVSERSALWGELFKDGERRFLRQVMEEMEINLALRDTYQVNIRAVWQPHAKHPYPGHKREGKTVVCLHSLSGFTNNSWCWIKMAKPLYQAGFNVILMEFPGCGRSKLNAGATIEPQQDWRRIDWHIVMEVIGELKLKVFYTVAVGESCMTLLRLLLNSPRSINAEHIFYKPVIDFDELFRDYNLMGARHVSNKAKESVEFRTKLYEKQVFQLSLLFERQSTKLLCVFDEANLAEGMQQTQNVFLAMSGKRKLKNSLFVEVVNNEDICEVQMGGRVPMRFLFPSKFFKHRVIDFLTFDWATAEAKGWDSMSDAGQRWDSERSPTSVVSPREKKKKGDGTYNAQGIPDLLQPRRAPSKLGKATEHLESEERQASKRSGSQQYGAAGAPLVSAFVTQGSLYRKRRGTRGDSEQGLPPRAQTASAPGLGKLEDAPSLPSSAEHQEPLSPMSQTSGAWSDARSALVPGTAAMMPHNSDHARRRSTLSSAPAGMQQNGRRLSTGSLPSAAGKRGGGSQSGALMAWETQDPKNPSIYSLRDVTRVLQDQQVMKDPLQRRGARLSQIQDHVTRKANPTVLVAPWEPDKSWGPSEVQQMEDGLDASVDHFGPLGMMSASLAIPGRSENPAAILGKEAQYKVFARQMKAQRLAARQQAEMVARLG